LLIEDLYAENNEKSFNQGRDAQVTPCEHQEHDLLHGHGQCDRADQYRSLMFANRVNEQLVSDQAEHSDHDHGGNHAPERMESQFVGAEINAVSRHHVKCRVGDVHDACYPEDQAKPGGEQSIHAPTDHTANDDVQDHRASVFNVNIVTNPPSKVTL
jgi:hypothetical protein